MWDDTHAKQLLCILINRNKIELFYQVLNKLNFNKILICDLQLTDWPFAVTSEDWQTQTDTLNHGITTYRLNLPRGQLSANIILI